MLNLLNVTLSPVCPNVYSVHYIGSGRNVRYTSLRCVGVYSQSHDPFRRRMPDPVGDHHFVMQMDYYWRDVAGWCPFRGWVDLQVRGVSGVSRGAAVG
jgi:hypothetical protein